MIDSNRIVEIQKGKNYGSGYAVTSNIILTAFHVVDNKSKDIIVRPLIALDKQIFDPNDIGKKFKAKCIWNDKETDVAVLKIIEGFEYFPDWHLPKIKFSRSKENRFKCSGIGFPEAMKNNLNADTYSMQGSIDLQTADKEQKLYIQITSALPEEGSKGWSGYSGTCIFSNQDELIGVVTDASGAYQGTLIASPIWNTFNEGEFEKIVYGDNKYFSPKLARRLTIKDLEEFKDISSYFNHTNFFKNEKPINLYDLITLLNSKDKLFWLTIVGEQGTGKSAFLSLLYKAYKTKIFPPKLCREPIYIDVSYFYRDEEKASIIDIRNFVKEIGKKINSYQGEFPLILMVDGLSGRQKNLSKLIYQEILLGLSESFDRFDSVIWSVSDGFEEDLEQIPYDLNLELPKRHHEFIKIKPIRTDVHDIETIIKNFIKLHEKIYPDATYIVDSNKIQVMTNKVHELISSQKVDLHILSLIYNHINNPIYFNQSLSLFLERYCFEKLNPDKIQENVDPDVIRPVASLAYKLVVQNFYSNREAIPDFLKNIAYDETNQIALNLIWEHQNIKDFLAAWHIVDLILHADNEKFKQDIEKDYLGYDFPYVINQFMRELINDSSARKNRVQDGIRTIIVFLDQQKLHNLHQTKSILYYLLGRGKEEIAQAKKLLIKQEKYDELRDIQEQRKRVFKKVLYRTYSVSLAYLDHDNEFLEQLIKDDELASIDRGYHRIYYGDSIAFKDKVPDCYLDNLNESWQESFEALKGHIEDYLRKNPDGSSGHLGIRRQHYVFTLLSFVQSRIANLETLSDLTRSQLDHQKAYAKKLVNTLLERKMVEDTEDTRLLYDYLKMVKIDLERDDLSPWRFVLDLYYLKFEPRRGWIHDGIRQGFSPDYAVRVESVADHLTFVVLLAKILLPEKLPPECLPQGYNDDHYSKENIIDMLLFHDIAEAYTGDFVFPFLESDKKDEARNKESSAVNYIRFKQTYDKLYGTIDIEKSIKEFSFAESNSQNNPNHPSVNAQIARDIDKLENLIQLYIYKEVNSNLADDAFNNFKKALREDNIYTPKLIGTLMDNFMAWADRKLDKGEKIFNSRCPEFYNPDLLEK